jgi:hypothetical protein
MIAGCPVAPTWFGANQCFSLRNLPNLRNLCSKENEISALRVDELRIHRYNAFARRFPRFGGPRTGVNPALPPKSRFTAPRFRPGGPFLRLATETIPADPRMKRCASGPAGGVTRKKGLEVLVSCAAREPISRRWSQFALVQQARQRSKGRKEPSGRDLVFWNADYADQADFTQDFFSASDAGDSYGTPGGPRNLRLPFTKSPDSAIRSSADAWTDASALSAPSAKSVFKKERDPDPRRS